MGFLNIYNFKTYKNGVVNDTMEAPAKTAEIEEIKQGP